jgi:hypothetical protein
MTAMLKLNAQHFGLQKLAIEVLRWSVSAKIILTATEVSVIFELLIRPDSNETNKNYLPDSKTILGICAGRIKIDDVSGQVRMHATVFECIVRKMPEFRLVCDCAIACAKYLSFKCFSHGTCRTQDEFNAHHTKYPFLDYAARYLKSHVKDHPEPSEELVVALLKLLENPGNRDAYLQALYADEADTKGFD